MSKLNRCKWELLSRKDSRRFLSAPVVLAAPLAAVRAWLPEEGGPGMRETTALVSAKKRAPDSWSFRNTNLPGRTV